MWFLGPKRTVRDVAEEIVNGLRDGNVVLSATLESEEPLGDGRPDDTPRPSHRPLATPTDSDTAVAK